MKPRNQAPALSTLKSAVALLNEIRPAFGSDLIAESREVARVLREAGAGEPPLDLLDDHLKAAIRSLFGEIEAFSYSLAQGVLSEPTLRAAVGNGDLAVLLEQEYDEQTGMVLPISGRYPLAQRLGVATRVFLTSCGEDPGAAAWDQAVDVRFKRLTRVRNHFTHPTRLEHLFVTHAFEDFRFTAVWYTGFAADLLRSASRRLGIVMPPVISSPELAPLGNPVPGPESVFNEEFYSRVFSDPGAAIAYIRIFAERLQREVRRAFDHASVAMSPPHDIQRIGHAARRMIRAVSTHVEGTIGFTNFFMRAVRRRNAKIVCPPTVKGEAPPDRIIRVLGAFSGAIGNGIVPRRNANWIALKKVFEMRDRLTHPRRPADARAGLEHLSISMKALSWFIDECMPALTIDLEKISDTYGRQRPAV